MSLVTEDSTLYLIADDHEPLNKELAPLVAKTACTGLQRREREGNRAHRKAVAEAGDDYGSRPLWKRHLELGSCTAQRSGNGVSGRSAKSRCPYECSLFSRRPLVGIAKHPDARYDSEAEFLIEKADACRVTPCESIDSLCSLRHDGTIRMKKSASL